MEIVRKLWSDRRVRIAMVATFLVGMTGLVMAWSAGYRPGDLKPLWQATEVFLRTHEWALFLAIVILPGLPVPTSALLLMAGVVWRDQPAVACGLSLLALALNLVWTYWLAAGPARRVMERVLAATSVKVPELPKNDHLKVILILKLTPGIPLFFQNYLLGLLQVPFFLYMGISILANGVIATGIVLSGAGMSDGNLMPALSGVSLIVVAVLLTQWMRGWLARKKDAKIKPAEG